MNIAIFTNNYLPNPYGVTGSIESFRKEFEKKGHTVYIFAPNYKDYKDENPNVFRYPSLDIQYKIKFPLSIPYSQKISKKLKELDIDIIHSQHPNLLGEEALKWAKIKNIPIVFTWHTLYDQYTHYIPLVPEKISSKWAIDNAVKYANKVNQVIVPTKSVKKIIEKWGVRNKNIINILTGVEEKKLQNSDNEKLRKRLKISLDKKIILSISRLTKEKNNIFLIKSLVKVLQKNTKIIFVLGGDGYQYEKLRQIVIENNLKKQVIFVGLIKEAELKDYFSLADIFVYASKSETQGTIITKAMYMGLPIVAVKATGIKDLIEDRRTGILVSCNKDNFSKAVSYLLNNKGIRNEVSLNARKVAREKYISDVCADKMLEVYNRLIRKNAKTLSDV